MTQTAIESHEGQQARPLSAFWIAAGVVGIVVLLVTIWLFFMTLDITVLALGLLAAVPLYALIVYWVWRDANAQGMPGTLWAIVVVFLFVLGLALYLVVRELKPKQDTA